MHGPLASIFSKLQSVCFCLLIPACVNLNGLKHYLSVFMLMSQGLPLNCLNLVFDLLIMSRLMCASFASPSWTGYLNVECISTIQKLFTKSVKWGVTSKSYQAADILMLMMKSCLLL